MPITLRMNIELVVYVAFKGAVNNTDEYVALKLEDKDPSSGLHNVVIAPHSKLRGSFDGAIFQDGTMVKVSAHAPVWVSFRIWRDKKGVVKYMITDGFSYVIDGFANAKKLFDNKFKNENDDYSGVYFNQNSPGAKLNKWWEYAMEDCKGCKDWKQAFESERQKELREKLQGSL